MTNYECENRISDDEIISSLEVIATTHNCSECKIRNCNWGDCNCSQITANAALDLINRQKAEIERLKECPKCIYEYDGKTTEYCVQGPCSNFKTVEQIKYEAYKEFAEKLKKRFYLCAGRCVVNVYHIDNLLKEYEKGRQGNEFI